MVGIALLVLGIVVTSLLRPSTSTSDKPAADFTNSIGMAFQLIPSGTFVMGSPTDEPDWEDNEFQHEVRISDDFYLGVTEVTQGQWKSVMGTEPWNFALLGRGMGLKEGDNYPASCVTWDDAVAFCEKLSQKEDVNYRLPTEAEWEYACRGGSESAYSFGNSSADFGKYGWFVDNSIHVKERDYHEVGLKLANRFGLHDMHGNLSEWCSDCYDSDYYREPSARTDPQGPDGGDIRVRRGGSFDMSPVYCRSAYRDFFGQDLDACIIGFRVVRSSK